MNKSTLRNFATSARKELLKKIEAKAMKIGITEDNIKKADIESSDAIFIDGKQLSKKEKIQRDKLIARINQNGFKQVMEEVAYTWFNRFTALRFMEVNDYLPTGVRVLSSSNPNSADPDMLNEALELDLEINKEFVYELKLNNKTEELFKYLIIKHCNDLNRHLPFMFETIDDYTEILFPEGLLARDSFVRQMTDVEMISEKDWEEVEIIGWLYQYYNTELNELVYDGNMSKSRIPKELLPSATQIFTPDWAVKYMVENSLGKLWLDRNPNDSIQEGWKYYLKNEEESNDKCIKLQNAQINPEEIKILDPCMGSGHILVYAFDVLMDIYKSCGYIPRDATKLILQKNLYGLEIEDRAYQLACFSVVMKARKYNRRIFDEKIELNLCSIVESNEIVDIDMEKSTDLEEKDIETANYLISVFKDAKEYGSILDIEKKEYESLYRSLVNNNHEVRDLFQGQLLTEVLDVLPKLIKQARIMTQKYELVITNPPYLGSSRMSPLLDKYVKKNFHETKSDLSAVMYQKAINSYSKEEGFISFITTTSWMFLRRFDEFRRKVIKSIEFSSLVDFGSELFDGKVGHNLIVAWVNRNSKPRTNMVAIRLVEYNYSKRSLKKTEYFNHKNRFYPNQSDFSKIPGSPIAYWVGENIINAFSNPSVGSELTTREGMATAGNDSFLRLWFEVAYPKITFGCKNNDEAISRKGKWFPYNKGGNYRKWYGNNEFIVNWENDGYLIRNNKDEKTGRVRSHNYNGEFAFKEGITWSAISSGSISVRYSEHGYLFDSKGAKGFCQDKDNLKYILGLLNSKVGMAFLEFFSPTMDFKVGDVIQIPLIFEEKEKIIEIVDENISISKIEWDSFETSWDFQQHPFIKNQKGLTQIKVAFDIWNRNLENQFKQQQTNEELLNSIFNEIYGLQDELTSEIGHKAVTIRNADLVRDIKSFISYAVGCTFGRYSLDEEGLIFAGGEFNPDRYKTYKADKDNILPILPDNYFEDNIVSRLINFVQVTFGEKSLTENLEFIADTLGKKSGETAKETIKRYFLNDFFKDHVKTYQKRPIYWLFTSGKHKAFNCLIYMHRYDKTTLSRIRTDYLHEYQNRFDAQKTDLLSIIEGDYSTKEISNAKKELKVLENKIDELKEYDEILHHMADMQIEIDLDDGVAVNYEKFKGLVAKI